MKTANILGTEYTIKFKNYNEDPLFDKRSIVGYCDSIDKVIVICNMNTYPQWEDEISEYCRKCERQTMRHEIIHAFLSESGLCESSLQYSGAWSKNEEMVDFFALQMPKLIAVFRDLGCEN